MTEAFVLAVRCLAIQQQAEPVLTGEVIGHGGALHLEECVGHGGEAKAAHAVGHGMDQHQFSFQW